MGSSLILLTGLHVEFLYVQQMDREPIVYFYCWAYLESSVVQFSLQIIMSTKCLITLTLFIAVNRLKLDYAYVTTMFVYFFCSKVRPSDCDQLTASSMNDLTSQINILD